MRKYLAPLPCAGGTLLALVFAASGLRAEDGGLGEVAKSLAGLDPQGATGALRAFFVITVLGAVPSIVLLATSFPRILVVLSFLRRALGAQDLPSNQVLAGLTLILTGLIMMPVWKRVHAEAYAPLARGELKSVDEALARAAVPLKEFMLAHTFERDLRLMVDLATSAGKGSAASASEGSAGRVADLNFFVVLPAFVLSELKLAFQMGFLIFLPFLVIDLAVSAVLVSLGMFLLPPSMISLPLKILVFVLADGWNLVVAQLIQGFQSLP